MKRMKDKQLQTREVTQLSVIILFVAVLLISNVVATKLIGIPGTDIVVDGGVFLFPLAYILGDIMTEVYGFRRTRLTILMGFFALFLLSLTIFIVQIAPPAQYWENQAAFETVLGIVPRIVVGSLVAYIVGELLNSYIMARMKVASN